MPSNKLSITLLSLIILIIGSTLFTFVHNQDREIYFEPDDHYSYLVNTSNIKHCKISDCYEKNFLALANLITNYVTGQPKSIKAWLAYLLKV